MVQVFLHHDNETEKVKALAQESDEKARRKGYLPLQMKLKRGEEVVIECRISGKTCIFNQHKTLRWQGSFVKCSFDYFVPDELDSRELSCEVDYYYHNALIGEMTFLTRIEERPQSLYAEIKKRTFEKIFISYAHEDAEQVKKLALAYKAQGVDYFFDRDKLGGGDVYEEKIFSFIDRADLFLLCWSKNAEQSEYVPKELNRALIHAYPQVSREEATLKVYPISLEPRAPYPDNIKRIYNFVEI